jgi:predicted transcriptional regulator
MQDCILKQKGAGVEVITQDDLAMCMNVKVSSSFRKHISELQSDGVVTRFTYMTDRGGYKVAYLIS